MNREIIPAGPKKGNTRDIINAIARALPVAVAQIKERNYKSPGAPIVKTAQNIGRLTRRRFTYVKDGLQFQDIKLPSALEATKTGDCKSLSLYIAAHLTALNIVNGLRFAAYGTDEPTHVYNWYLDENGKLHTLDACLNDLKESPNFTAVQDMQTRIIAGVPVLSEFEEMNGPRRDARRARRQERREDRQERREQRRAEGKGFGQRAKKISLALPRKAFIELLDVNFRGLATRLSKVNRDKVAGFWGKLGGDKNKLFAAIDKGKGRQPLFGSREPNVGFAAAAALTAAGGIILGAVKFLKDNGIEAGDLLDAVKKVAPGTEPLGNFEATDAETAEAAQLTKTTPGTTSPIDFKINPFLIAGGIAAAYLLTRKKGRK